MKIQTYKLLTIMVTFMTIILLIYIVQTNIKQNTIVNDSNDFNKYTDNSSDPYIRLDTILRNLNYNYIYTYKNFSSIYFSIAQYNNTNFSTNEYKVNNNDSDDYTGIRYHRDNFYFSTTSMGTESLQFEYPDGFILNLNITIN